MFAIPLYFSLTIKTGLLKITLLKAILSKYFFAVNTHLSEIIESELLQDLKGGYFFLTAVSFSIYFRLDFFHLPWVLPCPE